MVDTTILGAVAILGTIALVLILTAALATRDSLATVADEAADYRWNRGVAAYAGRPVGWAVGFVVLVAALVGIAFWLEGGLAVATALTHPVGGLVGLLVIAWLGYGTFVLLRGRGYPDAAAAGLGAILAGVVLVLAIAVQLLSL